MLFVRFLLGVISLLCEGNTGIDEMMTSLIHAVDMFTEQRQTEIEQEVRNFRRFSKEKVMNLGPIS